MWRGVLDICGEVLDIFGKVLDMHGEVLESMMATAITCLRLKVFMIGNILL